MKVLYLSEWYPHRYDAMAGLFVRKHAQAVVRQGVDVTVLYMHLDPAIQKEEMVEQVTDGVKEVYIYYPHKFGYLRAFRHGYQHIKRSWGRPDLCQLNVITKNGLLPLYLWKVLSIPYIIVEHWTGYTQEHKGSIRPGLHLALMRYIAKQARAILPVSQDLVDAMQQHGFVNDNYRVINNVVDDFFYTTPLLPHSSTPTTFGHISCFDNKAKNIKGILRSISQVLKTHPNFHFSFVGVGQDWKEDVDYAHQLGLDSWVTFTGELSPKQVCENMKSWDCLVLFSNYENAPVVISEALAMGIPVLSTNAGGIPEMVDSSCSVLVEIGNEEQMAQAIRQFIEGKVHFDAEIIREHGKQYSFEAVGKELKSIYQSAVSRS